MKITAHIILARRYYLPILDESVSGHLRGLNYACNVTTALSAFADSNKSAA
jgi:hypothetical protein